MRNKLLIIVILLVGRVLGQDSSLIRLNHLMIVVDLTTYEVLASPDFMSSGFAFTQEKEFESWKGVYLIGKDNYLEFFHSNSIVGEEIEPGFNWTCLSSLKSGYLDTAPRDTSSCEYESDDYFNYLSYNLNDSTTAFSVYEMKRKQYESWVQKEFTEGMSFEPVDYNSPEESDSSKNYLFKNITAVNYTIPSENAESIADFFINCGFSLHNESENLLEFSNGEERINLFLETNGTAIFLNSIELELNFHLLYESFILGTSQIVVQGKKAVWHLR